MNGLRVRSSVEAFVPLTGGEAVRYRGAVRVTGGDVDDQYTTEASFDNKAEALAAARRIASDLVEKLTSKGAKVRCMKCGERHGVMPCPKGHAS